MFVKIVLLKDVNDNQNNKNIDDHVRQVKGIKESKRPNFKHRLNSELKGKVSKLHLLMKLSLIVFKSLTLVRQVFNFLALPHLIGNVNQIQDKLKNNKSVSLSSNHEEFGCTVNRIRNRKEDNR